MECINPFAYLYLLSSISTSFGTMMKDCAKDPTTPLRLILYIDEVNPGNPLRPDRGRTTHAIQWSFADWPAWTLQFLVRGFCSAWSGRPWYLNWRLVYRN